MLFSSRLDFENYHRSIKVNDIRIELKNLYENCFAVTSGLFVDDLKNRYPGNMCDSSRRLKPTAA